MSSDKEKDTKKLVVNTKRIEEQLGKFSLLKKHSAEWYVTYGLLIPLLSDEDNDEENINDECIELIEESMISFRKGIHENIASKIEVIESVALTSILNIWSEFTTFEQVATKTPEIRDLSLVFKESLATRDYIWKRMEFLFDKQAASATAPHQFDAAIAIYIYHLKLYGVNQSLIKKFCENPGMKWTKKLAASAALI